MSEPSGRHARGDAGDPVSLARAHLANRRYFPAIAAAEELLARQPGHAEALYLRAAAMTRMGHARAAPAGQEAVRAAPGDWRTHLVLGQALLKAGRPGEGAMAAREAVRLAPEQVEVLVGFAELAQLAGDPAGARWGYEQALRLAPDHAGARHGLGEVELSEGRLGKAASHFAAAASAGAAADGAGSGGGAAFREIVRRLVVAGAGVATAALVTLVVLGRIQIVEADLGAGGASDKPWLRGLAGVVAVVLLVAVLAVLVRMPRGGWALAAQAVRAEVALGIGLLSIGGTVVGLGFYAAAGTIAALPILLAAGVLGWGSRALLT
jgi:Flp pilus assembly protein TadD